MTYQCVGVDVSVSVGMGVSMGVGVSVNMCMSLSVSVDMRGWCGYRCGCRGGLVWLWVLVWV